MNHINNNKRLWRRWLSFGVCAALLLPLISDGWNTAWAEPSKASTEQRVLRIGSLWSGEDDSFFVSSLRICMNCSIQRSSWRLFRP